MQRKPYVKPTGDEKGRLDICMSLISACNELNDVLTAIHFANLGLNVKVTVDETTPLRVSCSAQVRYV